MRIQNGILTRGVITSQRVTITITGENLGDSRHKKVEVMLGQYECKYARWITPGRITCVVSPGFGKNNTVDVAIRGFRGEEWYHANLTVSPASKS